MMKKGNLITALKEIMEKEIEILFAYLYGSYAHNVRIKEGIVSNSPKSCFKNNPCFWKERNSLFTVFTT